MDHGEQIQTLIMSAVADDYEDLEMILHEVTRWCLEDGLPFTPNRSDILAGLTALLHNGLVKAYDLWKTPPETLQLARSEGIVVPPADHSEIVCYFS